MELSSGAPWLIIIVINARQAAVVAAAVVVAGGATVSLEAMAIIRIAVMTMKIHRQWVRREMLMVPDEGAPTVKATITTNTRAEVD
ncbi:hypothetical protein M0802_011225 [Mischocyttarus mexicanus]|nr:hypothetical protein M0802_011225 [Mischocyttarus mexicanus]